MNTSLIADRIKAIAQEIENLSDEIKRVATPLNKVWVLINNYEDYPEIIYIGTSKEKVEEVLFDRRLENMKFYVKNPSYGVYISSLRQLGFKHLDKRKDSPKFREEYEILKKFFDFKFQKRRLVQPIKLRSDIMEDYIMDLVYLAPDLANDDYKIEEVDLDTHISI